MLNLIRAWFSTLGRYTTTLYRSFYSSVLYADVVKRWHGLGIAYLLFIIMLGVIPLSARVIVAFNDFFKDEILFPIKAIPLAYIKNGELIDNHAMPYIIKNPKGDIVTIADTNGTVSEINNTYPKLSVLITKHDMYFRPPSYQQFLGLAKDNTGNPIYTRHFDKGANGILSGTEWIQSTGMIKLNLLMQCMVYPSLIVFYVVVFGVVLFLLSALVQLFSDIFLGFKLSFESAYRLLAVAITPTLILFFVMRGFDVALPGMGFIDGVLFLSYVCYGLYAAKHAST